MRRDTGVVAAALCIALVGCDPSELAPTDADAPLRVSRGDLEQHLTLTGEVDAARAVQLSVPRTDEWSISIRWMAEDGALVKAGDPVVAFDNTAVLAKVSERELAVIEAGVDLATQEAKAGVEVADKAFEVSKQHAEVDKAKLDVSVPAELISRKEARDFAVALSRADAALTQAQGELDKATRGGRLESSVKRIAYDKAYRAFERTDKQVDALELKAPRDGVFIVGKHMWEGRKLQVGDNVWPGVDVGELPDLSRLVIEAGLSDVDEGRLHPGMAASCTVDAYPEAPLQGMIRDVSPVAQEAARQTRRRFFNVVVELDAAAGDHTLRPGLSVRVDVVTGRAEQALLAPRSGLDLAAHPVVAHLADGRDVEIEVDFCDAQYCVVTSGLEEGQELSVHERHGDAR